MKWAPKLSQADGSMLSSKHGASPFPNYDESLYTYAANSNHLDQFGFASVTGSSLNATPYRYDADGSITLNPTPQLEAAFQYDARGRLVGVTGVGPYNAGMSATYTVNTLQQRSPDD